MLELKSLKMVLILHNKFDVVKLNMEKDIRQIKSIYEKTGFLREQKENKEVEHLRKVLFSLTEDLDGKKILFIGCGDGEECVPYEKSGAKVYGIDISSSLITEAKLINHSGKFMVGDFRDLTINNSFDIVLSILSLHYSGDLKSSLSKVYSLLKPGGTCIIATTHPTHKMISYNNGNYFRKGKVWYTWKGVKRFNYFYLIEDYINGFAKSNLFITKMIEVFTPVEFRSKENKKNENPIFTIYKVRKPRTCQD